jgi:hypothetical protein
LLFRDALRAAPFACVKVVNLRLPWQRSTLIPLNP